MPAFASVTAGLAFTLLVLPWLNPFAPGPSPAAVPLLFSWLCGALALGLGGWRRPALVAWAWAAAAAASAMFGLAQYFGLAELAGGLINFTERGTAYGNLRQRNQFATLLSIGVLAVLYLAGRGLPNRLATPLLALLAVASAASTSRTGLLQLLVIAALCIAWADADRKGVAYRCLAALLAYAGAALLLPLLFNWLTGEEAASLWGRVASGPGCASRRVLWSNVLELIVQRPWTGWGIAELDYAHYAHLYDGARFCDILDNAHNLPLHVAVEAGLPLALLLLGGAAYLVWRLKPWQEGDPVRQLAWAVIVMLALHSLVEYPLWYGPFQLALLLAVLMLCRVRAGRTPPLRSAGRIAAFLAIPLVLAYAAWDYHRVSQLYLPPEERASAYRDDTLQKASASKLFARQVKFAELSITPLTAANAAALHELALDMLHFSPEPKVIETVIDSAMLRRDEPAALWHMARYRAAFPKEYEAWIGRAVLPAASQ